MQILFLCLLLPVWLCGALLPGDFGVVQISQDQVTILALKSIPANEQIQVRDQFWSHGRFTGTGSGGSFSLTRQLKAGDTYSIDLSDLGISFDWGETLHFYQDNTAPNMPKHRHLFMVEANQSGLRWHATPPGLELDLTHIIIREISGYDDEINHVYNSGLLDLVNLNLTPYRWLRALGSFRSWIHADQLVDLPLLDLLQLKFLVLPSPGTIEFMADAYHLKEGDDKISIPVRRLYGNSGSASVQIESTTIVEPLYEWENKSVDNFYADLTDAAYSPKLGYAIAVSPDSGSLLLGRATGWQAVDTNGDPQTNLGLSSITYDGERFWACSLSGRIYKSANGIDWTLEYMPSGTQTSFYRIVFLKEAKVLGKPSMIALGSEGQILYQDPSDGWQLSSTDSSHASLFSVAFDGQTYVAVGGGGTILLSQDLSRKWEAVSSSIALDLYGIYYSSASSGGGFYAVGQFGTMLYAQDLVGGFSAIESGTTQTLFSMQSVALEVDSDTGQTANFLVACGAGGTVTAAKDGSNFALRRSIHRASALYSIIPIVSASAVKADALIAIGEDGAIVEMSTNSHPLSGNPEQILLNDAASSTLEWSNLDNSEKYVEVQARSVDKFRQRTDLLLQQPINSGNYRLGRHRTQVNLMDAVDSQVQLAPNFGPLLYMTDMRVEINSADQWEFKFILGNTSNRESGRLFLRFEDTNMPDWEIPTSLLPGNGDGIAALSVSGDIVKVLSQPVETVSLYEGFRSGESVLKYKMIVNSLWASPEWSPNDIFPRSLGIYLLDNGSLLDPGIPGIADILDLTGGIIDDIIDLPLPFGLLTQDDSLSLVSPSTTARSSILPLASYSMNSYSSASTSSGGSTFSDGVPTPSRNAPGDPELILTDTDTQGPTGMELRASYTFFLEGDFYNTGTGLNEVYTINTVDWSLSEDAEAAEGLSIDADGSFTASPNPSFSYPREISTDSMTTEGAPLDDKGEPIEFTDSQIVTLTRASSDLNYSDWIAGISSLTGDEALSDADPDLDGQTNLLEFALDRDPESSDQSAVLIFTHDATSSISTFEFTLPNDRAELVYTLETTTDLSANPVVWTQQSLTLSADLGSSETWEASIRNSGQIFGRLRVEEDTP
ncbi:hypothetical protein SH580_19430 [Coraliomargarita algicola]|uniref:Photosynthesis system II assembly factor Ycf48/Hcf136-like domain-containing protein n=1 Tax=Coraliomargarita algicola TaxID=3092156 RepID=A0ABZ0RKH6_9BACT|nr:hypothetical protein [Coraliomargarita sp. J2-16]WPJ95593.1 hypothetical protein SH580_19430 [Coraliomargarita sp. J2-16]